MIHDPINNPTHYTQYPIEVIDMMISLWGKEKVITFCTLNAFKYRMRAGHKNSLDQDIAKERWYLNKAKELRSQLN